jgi:uncharacterized protein (TIGR00369 family)
VDSLRDRVQAIKDGKAEPPPIAKTLGMNLLEAAEGKVRFSMKVDQRFHNPMGTLHGGIMTDLADASMGVALATLLADDESFTTLDLNIHFLRPVYEGELVAEARVVHRGRTIALVEAVLKNDEGKEVARAAATQLILKPK